VAAELPLSRVESFELAVYRGDDLVAAATAAREAPYSTLAFDEASVWLTTSRGLDGFEIVEPACRLFSITSVSDFPIDLSRIVRVLGEHGVGIIPLSSYGGDHLLVKDEHVDQAIDALVGDGYTVTR
jgi:hypothetical protein